MGARRKARAKRLALRERKAEVGGTTHRDKYAAEAARERRACPVDTEPTTAHGPRTEPVKPKPLLTNEARVRRAAQALDTESEQNMRSLPGGTIEERLRSARDRLFQDQDAIQATLDPPKAER